MPELEKFMSDAPRLTDIIFFAGTPCQGLTRANVEANGKEDPRSQLLLEVVRLISILQSRYPYVRLHFLLGNVTSVSRDSIDWFYDTLQVRPCRICPVRLVDMRCPRLYWCNWEHKGSRAEMIEKEGFVEIKLEEPGRFAFEPEVFRGPWCMYVNP